MGKKRNKSAPAPAPTEAVDPANVAPDVDAPANEADTVAESNEAPVDTPDATETNEAEDTTTAEETPADDGNDESADEAEDASEPADEPETPAPAPTEDAQSSDTRVFWVEGYGNVNAKSQAEAEKKAKKIVADRRK